jgi:hypothetical protein
MFQYIIYTVRRYPELYAPGRLRSGFHLRIFWAWVAIGIRDSLFVFYFVWMALCETAAADNWTTGLASYSVLVLLINVKMFIFTSSWNWINHFFTWLTVILYCFCAWGYSSSFYWSYQLYGAFQHIVVEPAFYLALLCVLVAAMVPDLLTIAWLRNYRTQLVHVVQERRELFGERPETYDAAAKEWTEAGAEGDVAAPAAGAADAVVHVAP